ncbi:Interferon-stimulated 20 kDa exonuclease-like 2, partial [Ophiophagus hannah]
MVGKRMVLNGGLTRNHGHSSVEDAQASMELYRLVEFPWEELLTPSHPMGPSHGTPETANEGSGFKKFVKNINEAAFIYVLFPQRGTCQRKLQAQISFFCSEPWKVVPEEPPAFKPLKFELKKLAI